MGRLTPCIFKALMSAKWSQFKREISAPLSGLLAVASSSPHLRPQSVRAHIQSAITTAVVPCPRTIHVRHLSANMSVSSQRPDRDLSVATSGRCASRGRGLTEPWPSNSLELRAGSVEGFLRSKPRNVPRNIQPLVAPQSPHQPCPRTVRGLVLSAVAVHPRTVHSCGHCIRMRKTRACLAPRLYGSLAPSR